MLVAGLPGEPEVVLNGQRLPGGFEKVEADGRTWYRIPIGARAP
jgi:hypothetical protein